jgi:hypothetical protein
LEDKKMETRHIRLEYGEAVEGKKHLLSAELNLLHVLKQTKNYKLLRKKEFTLRNKIKTLLTSVKTKTNLVRSTFPDEAVAKIKRKRGDKIVVEKLQKEPRSDIQKELETIQKKLRELG